MKFYRLEIENFMAIDSAALGLGDRGLVLIQGKNLDDESAVSNGAGKSSITDALSWCLFGVTARGETGDAIINSGAKFTSVKVKVAVEDGEGGKVVYQIERYRKHSEYKNRVRLIRILPKKADLTLGTDRETQQRINTLLGCDAKVFNAAIYQGQERLPDLPNFTDKQLKELVEETAGINILQKCLERARLKQRELGAELETCETETAYLQRMLDKAELDLDIQEEKAAEWDEKHEEAVKLQQETVDAYKINYEEVKARHDKAEEKRASIQATIDALTESLKERNQQLEEHSELERQASAQRSKVLLEKRTVDDQTTMLGNRTKQLEGVQDTIDTPCSKCGKLIEECDLDEIIVRLKDEIAEVSGDLIHSRKVHEKAKDKLAKAEKKAEDFKAEIPSYTESTEKLSKCLTVIEKMNALAANVELKKTQLDSAEEALEHLLADTNPRTAIVEDLKDQTVSYGLELDGLKAEEKQATKAYKAAEKVTAVFAPGGVRAHILDHVTPFLNARTGHYLSSLSDGNIQAVWTTLSKTAKGELREKFTIEVTNGKGGKSFGLLSGGEKRKVRLACSMALQDVVAQRASKPIDLFMADEIDDALDEAGLERLMGLLDEKARERGTVLVISHRSLGDWIREVAMVTKEGGKATISGSLNLE